MLFKKYDTPQKSRNFRPALIEIRGRKCECCGLEIWLNQPIHLEVHHIDGDKSNNQLDNLQLLCPNCHSYTDNYGSLNKKKKPEVSDDEIVEAVLHSNSIRQALQSLYMSDAGANYTRVRKVLDKRGIKPKEKIKPETYCADCGKLITEGSLRCIACENKRRSKSNIDRDTLKALIRTTPFTQIGKKYNVTDNAVRKWCDKYGLPRKSSDIKKMSDEEWEKV